MKRKVLITGGAGFIGSNLVDKLINMDKYEVTVFDVLEEQVHGKITQSPDYLNKKARFIYGSVTDYEKLKELVQDHEIIYHLAAAVGVGQSMYRISKYIDYNVLGTANLLDIIVNCEHDVNKLIIASSNTVYGEGKYSCDKCGVVFPKLRDLNQLKSRNWGLNCPICGIKVKPLLTDENTPLDPSSIYAISKQTQEQSSILIGKVFGINTTVLRLFLVYGSRQALSNPYTGICSIFCTRLLNGKPPIVFEDGNQSRDFVNIEDVCQALYLAIEKNSANGEIFNVGTGQPVTIREVAEIITNRINPKINPIFNQKFRIGDIRHCIADISKIQHKLGYTPSITFEEGIDNLINWVKEQTKTFKDNSKKSMKILKEKGLLK
ncbi:MAG: GDP-mannose 4,6-dehydratase [Promethearchaeota archaeon]